MIRRPIYITSYNSPLFLAHWNMRFPSYDAETDTVGDVGKVIHVVGGARNGFSHQFRRNYNMATTTRSKTIHCIGWTDGANIAAGGNDGLVVEDTIVTDVFEELALSVAAPGSSLRSEGDSSSSPRNRVQIQNCQTWLYEFVAKQVENKVLSDGVLEKLDAVPKN